jgi:hypothetical protein
MNHTTIEFLARDRIAGMRQDADQHGYEPPERATRRPFRIVSLVPLRRLIGRLASATFVTARHG